MYRFITLWGVIGGSGDRNRIERSRLATCLAGLAVVAALAAGCGGSDGGTALPPLTPSATSTGSTPSATPTHETKRQELAQAKAVVRRYYAVLNQLRRTMDAAALSRVLAPSCPCRAQVRAIRRAAAKGEHYTDHAEINSIRTHLDSRRRAEAVVDYNASRGGLADSSGHRVTSSPPKNHVEWSFSLGRISGSWLILSIQDLG